MTLLTLFAPVPPDSNSSSSFPWFGIILLALVVWGGISLGLKGFKDEGIPLAKNTNITGSAAKVIGVICFALGLLAIYFILMMIRGSRM
ncbi:MAG TPA: hypothetical protein VJT09_06750 [Pyrinomonadaceae bacterium]|nr:hypothetical protein [Pyrinomonadaceae bacterium]